MGWVCGVVMAGPNSFVSYLKPQETSEFCSVGMRVIGNPRRCLDNWGMLLRPSAVFIPLQNRGEGINEPATRGPSGMDG